MKKDYEVIYALFKIMMKTGLIGLVIATVGLIIVAIISHLTGG